MAKTLPFLILGGLAAFAFLTDAQPANSQSTAKRNVFLDAPGSVVVKADLERSKMLQGKSGEVYARVLLEGVDAPAPTERMPISLTIVIDKSGSMSGDKIVNARNSAISALDLLQKGDRASVVIFGSSASVLVTPLVIGDTNVDAAKRKIGALHSSGGTNMHAALDVSKQIAKQMYSESRTNRVLLLSDGQPDNARGLEDKVASLAKEGILTTTLGIGRGYNEDLMAKLADAGLANYYFVESSSQMAQIFEKELKAIAAVVAKEAVVSIALKNGVVVKEVFGYGFSRGEHVVAIAMGDIYARQKSEVLLKLQVPASVGDTKLIDVKVTYHDVIAKQAKRVKRTLAANFIKNATEVERSANVAVFTKAEKVRTADAMKRAAVEAKAGRRSQARDILAKQKARVVSYKNYFGQAAAPAAAEMEEAIADLDDEASDSRKDMNVGAKKAKARARKMSR
ncbi:MAG: VWA domain-containing protein [Deltaproteobacteria bacterium]|nr:VWA domain-containing protein [Deltaproteobacteria bacterium]